MRDNVKGFVKCCSRVFQPPDPVFEIGSLQVPQQIGYADLRPFFKSRTYVGCDMREGPGVDRIENVEALGLPDGTVGTMIMADTLEHVENPHRALDEVHRVIRNGGMVIMTSVQNFPIHDYPRDFWRFTPEAFSFLLRKFSARLVGAQGDLTNPHTVFGIGFKRAVSEEEFDRFRHCFLNELSASKRGGGLSATLKKVLRAIPPEEVSFNLHGEGSAERSFRANLAR